MVGYGAYQGLDSLAAALREKSWPTDGIEKTESCPVCKSAERHLLYGDLTDNVFFAAPGEWTMWQCEQCRSAYLDPRPDEASIGIAYSHYYTHEEATTPPAETHLQRLRAKLGNGYRNARYGTNLQPASKLGPTLATLCPPLGWPVDVAYRYMKRPVPSFSARVLDIGCGNGDFLEMARAAGWKVAGADPDPIARARALKRGIEVRETAADWLAQPATFDFVTMSHVIEHVHDPLQLLTECCSLLRPGGGIFIDTPNLDALGHRLYGRNWRGLEPPRHLALFNRKSLIDAVRQSGFQNARYRHRFYPFAGMSLQSRRIAAGLDPLRDHDGTVLSDEPSRFTRFKAMVTVRQSEFLTLTAERDS